MHTVRRGKRANFAARGRSTAAPRRRRTLASPPRRLAAWSSLTATTWYASPPTVRPPGPKWAGSGTRAMPAPSASDTSPLPPKASSSAASCSTCKGRYGASEGVGWASDQLHELALAGALTSWPGTAQRKGRRAAMWWCVLKLQRNKHSSWAGFAFSAAGSAGAWATAVNPQSNLRAKAARHLRNFTHHAAEDSVHKGPPVEDRQAAMSAARGRHAVTAMARVLASYASTTQTGLRAAERLPCTSFLLSGEPQASPGGFTGSPSQYPRRRHCRCARYLHAGVHTMSADRL